MRIKPPSTRLKEVYLTPLGLSQSDVGRAAKIPINRINQILSGKRAITADTALRLAAVFQAEPELFLTWQMEYDLALARERLKGSKVRPTPIKDMR